MPVLASSVGAAAEETEVEVSFIQLDAATSTDTGKKQDASETDIVLDFPSYSSGPSVTVNGKSPTGTQLTFNEGDPLVFEVTSDQPCILLYESGDPDEFGYTGIVQVASEAGEGSTHKFSTYAWAKMKVYFSVKGDADSSGSVDETDVSAVENMILTNNQPTGMSMYYTDTNGDGVIDTKDLTALRAQIHNKRDLGW